MANKPTVAETLSELGFDTMGVFHFGTWQGYAVTHYLNQGYECFHFAVRTDKKDKQLAKSLLAAVRTRCPKRFKTCMNLGDSVAFNLTADRKQDYREQITLYLNAMTEALYAANVAPAATCAHCGAAAPDSLCLVGSKFQPVHAHCVHNAKDAAVEAAQRNEESGSYLTGTLGAVVGTLVGIIPSVLSILFLERIYALLFALVPLAAMYGYRLCKGKQSKGSIAIIVVLSIVGVFILQGIVAVIGVAQDYGRPIGEVAAKVVPYLLTGEGIADIASNSLMEFLFMAFGIFFAWRYLNQTNASTVAAANAVESTLRPINTQY